MRSEQIPIINLKGNLLVSLQHDLNDHDALTLQEGILKRLAVSGAKGVIIDVSGVEVIDSFIARVFNDIGGSAYAMGARTVIVGLQPGVALTLVEMGVDLFNTRTVMHLDDALDFLGDGR